MRGGITLLSDSEPLDNKTATSRDPHTIVTVDKGRVFGVKRLRNMTELLDQNRQSFVFFAF